jgi:hypothetical protein
MRDFAVGRRQIRRIAPQSPAPQRFVDHHASSNGLIDDDDGQATEPDTPPAAKRILPAVAAVPAVVAIDAGAQRTRRNVARRPTLRAPPLALGRIGQIEPLIPNQ